MRPRHPAEHLRPEEVANVSDSLPGPEFWAQIHPHTGDVTDVQRTERGSMSDLTALVECEKGPFFVKAVRNQPGGRLDSLVREQLINPFVRPLSPELLWHSDEDAWAVLGFEVIKGRFADFTPGSADLPVIVELVNRVGRLELPGIAADWTETRWDRFAQNEAEAELFRGDTLLYTDINEDNLLIGERVNWVVDWAWPTRGAAFIDPACLVLQLISSGHSPESAEGWAAHCPAWANADPKSVDAFATAYVYMLRRFFERSPEAEWFGAMARSAEEWTTHRGISV